MPERNSPNFDEVLQHLANSILESYPDTVSIKKDLEEDGIDVDAGMAKLRASLERLEGKKRLERAKELRAKFLEMVRAISPGPPKWDSVKSWFEQQHEEELPEDAALVFFRRLESVQQEDMESLVEDTGLLEEFGNLFEQTDDDES